MPSFDDWRRPGPTPRQRRHDLIIALVVIAGALFNVLLSRSVGVFVFGWVPTLGEQLIWAFAITVPLIWRRARPELVMIVVAVIFIAGQVRGTQETQFASALIFTVIYSVGAWGQDRVRARWLRVGVIAAMFFWLAVAWVLQHDEISAAGLPGASGDLPPLLAAVVNQVLLNVLLFGFAYLFGETAWLAARRQAQLSEQAEQLRAAQAVAAERAVLGERVRIARELHDVVAHHVSVMGIQAAAARRAMDKDAGKARTALSAVEQSSRTAVDELHRMLGALRAVGDLEPAAAGGGLDRVEELAVRVREAGLRADVATYGEPVPVPDSMSRTAYRIVQEAVTNTLKHAHASTVDIRLRWLNTELEIDVADDGRGGAAGASGGMGLIGMRERVAVHHGTVEAGPRPGGGFRVRARLPLPDAPRPDPPSPEFPGPAPARPTPPRPIPVQADATRLAERP